MSDPGTSSVERCPRCTQSVPAGTVRCPVCGTLIFAPKWGLKLTWWHVLWAAVIIEGVFVVRWLLR
jgi:hypothetical protein